MTLIVNATEGARLRALDNLSTMLTDEYLADKTHPQTKFIFDQFFDGGSLDIRATERLNLLNISYSIPSILADKFADYVGEPQNDLGVSLEDFVSTFIWGGYAVFNCRLVEDDFVVDVVQPQEYILHNNGSQRVLTYLDDYDDLGNLIQYILDQRIEKNIITNKLYKINYVSLGNKNEIHGDQVPLSTYYATSAMQEVEQLSIDRSPLVVVNNKKVNNKLYGTSEILKIRSLISSIEVEAVNIQDNFLKHLSSILALPINKLQTDKKGKVDITKLKAIGMEAGDTLPSYIMNTNPLIKDSFTQIDSMLRQICAITSIPVEFMGLSSPGGAESADAKKIRMASFLKKVEKIRSKFENGLKQVAEIRAQFLPKFKSQDFILFWPEIFPVDKNALASELATAQNASLISNKKAIMKYQDLNEEDAIAEREAILKEKATVQDSELGI